jgi:hypothetical protein
LGPQIADLGGACETAPGRRPCSPYFFRGEMPLLTAKTGLAHYICHDDPEV